VGSEYATFLGDLRVRTERAWQAVGDPPTTFFGPYWQQGTRWAGRASANDVERAQKLAGGALPDDYRDFLLDLHTTDSPMLMRDRSAGGRIVPVSSFTDWRANVADIAADVRATRTSLIVAALRAGTWLASWGEKPETREDQEGHLDSLIAKAPPLIPVFRHRYLVADATSAVLSIKGGDVIVFAISFRQYLINELSAVLQVPAEVPREIPLIPFWSELIAAL